jgi:hypothetical protein
MDFDNPKVKCYTVTAIVALVLIIGGLALSTSTVEPIEFAL